ncbi:hypothetical protein DL96DRAFT_1615022 [Flagelloscypha sp. PMI_526]|nr:hypothetical protein DL96DRAFT_1615022 [Flagelloscypha sp. PMI_526]
MQGPSLRSGTPTSVHALTTNHNYPTDPTSPTISAQPSDLAQVIQQLLPRPNPIPRGNMTREEASSSPSPQLPSQRTPVLGNSSSLLGFIRGEDRREFSPERPGDNGHSGGVFNGMLRRRRSANNVAASTSTAPAQNTNNGHHTPPPLPQAPTIITSTSVPPQSSAPSPAIPSPSSSTAGHRIRLVPHLDSRRNLKFDPIVPAITNNTSNKLAFKSKVVSRNHAELSVSAPSSDDREVKFYVRDTKSSSGTFLNHLRLSPAGQESRKFELRDGDLLQLGVDYQGGTEDIYKSVKIRVEVGKGREWQAGRNKFNEGLVKNLRGLAAQEGAAEDVKTTPTTATKKSGSGATPIAGIPDCCICLFTITIRQSLFIAPCSHTFHYKCIRPLLEQHHPSFSCPLCRTYADLEEDVEVEAEDDDEGESGEDSSDEVRNNVGKDPGVDAAGGMDPDADEEDDELNDALAASAALVQLRQGPNSNRTGPGVGAETDVEDFAPLLAIAASGGGGTLVNPGGSRRVRVRSRPSRENREREGGVPEGGEESDADDRMVIDDIHERT